MATSSSFLSKLIPFFTQAVPPLPSATAHPKAPPPSHVSLSVKVDSPPNPIISSNLLHSNSEVTSVICPSLAYANTLFFRSAYNVQVIVDDNEPEEKLLGRFRREVMKAGVIQECKRRRFFENKQDEKKRKTREAAKRNRRRRPQWRNGADREETSKSNKRVEDDDNWDMPEGALS